MTSFSGLAPFIAGVVIGAGLIGLFLLPASARGKRIVERELAELRGTHAQIASQLGEMKTELARTATARGLAERRTVSLEATLTQMRATETQVEARFRETAQQFVDRARETLVESAAQRAAADSNVLQGKLVEIAAPLQERLGVLTMEIGKLDKQRAAESASFKTILDGLGQKMERLDAATEKVASVLSSSTARGSWGEYELRRLIEFTGMTEHVSFDVQESGYGDEQRGRPDVVLRLPGDLTVPVDAKVPFAAYQQAIAATSVQERTKYLDLALVAVRGHVRALGVRKYHATPGCVGWTVMFIPIEAMISALFAHDPTLLEGAREERILIASPLTLMLYLDAFARGWSVQRQSENAEKILDEARELVERLRRFGEPFGKIGKQLESALDAYNAAVGSYQTRLVPQARRLIELGVHADAPAPISMRKREVRPIVESRMSTLTSIVEDEASPLLGEAPELEAIDGSGAATDAHADAPTG